MKLNYNPVTTCEQILDLAQLAEGIWHEYFASILSLEQINYMVDQFQSEAALTDQIQNQGYRYFLLDQEGETIGYTAVKEDADKLFLSKLYIRKEHRGKGYANQAFAFLEEQCLAKSLLTIWLTVNRYNENTIRIYEKKGFEILRSQVVDIGKGFVMDDYVMEKTL